MKLHTLWLRSYRFCSVNTSQSVNKQTEATSRRSRGVRGIKQGLYNNMPTCALLPYRLHAANSPITRRTAYCHTRPTAGPVRSVWHRLQLAIPTSLNKGSGAEAESASRRLVFGVAR